MASKLQGSLCSQAWGQAVQVFWLAMQPPYQAGQLRTPQPSSQCSMWQAWLRVIRGHYLCSCLSVIAGILQQSLKCLVGILLTPEQLFCFSEPLNADLPS